MNVLRFTSYEKECDLYCHVDANCKGRESGQVNARWVNSFCVTGFLGNRVMAVYRAKYVNYFSK